MTRSTTARRTLAAVGLAAVCVLPACSLVADTDEASSSATASSPATDSPSTPEETAEPTEAPVVDEEGEPVATDPPRPGAIDVVLSNAYWDPAEAAVFAAGYVSPVVEDGGTCTLRVSRDGNVVRATSEGIADASTTACGGLVLPGDELSPGTWSVVLSYESGSASGESEPLEVEVPE